MRKPLFEKGDDVIVYCHCGCTNHGRGKVLAREPFKPSKAVADLAKTMGKRPPKFIYRVDCAGDDWLPEHWLHPIPPTEPAMDKLNEQIGQWAKEAEAEPA